MRHPCAHRSSSKTSANLFFKAVSYQMCQAFWQPSLPFLARNTPAAIEARRALAAGEIDDVEYEKRQTLQHNKLSNVAFGSMSLGYTIVLVIALGAASPPSNLAYATCNSSNPALLLHPERFSPTATARTRRRSTIAFRTTICRSWPAASRPCT